MVRISPQVPSIPKGKKKSKREIKRKKGRRRVEESRRTPHGLKASL
jgi:hypothetical protein